MLRSLLIVTAIIAIQGCVPKPPPDLKSPCVGAEGSPCDRRPVNTWLEEERIKS